MAAEALGKLAGIISEIELAQQVAHALRDRLTDTIIFLPGLGVNEAAFQTLEQVANRLTVLEIDDHPIEDILAYSSIPARFRWWKRFPAQIAITAVAGLLGAFYSFFVRQAVEDWLPEGPLGMVLLIIFICIVVAAALSILLERLKDRQD